MVWGVPQKCVPAIVDVSHRGVEAIYGAWRTTLRGYVKEIQGRTMFGSSDPKKLDEIEVDESVVRKQDIGNIQVQWNEIVGLKRRGDRKSLVVMKRPAARASAASPFALICHPATWQYRHPGTFRHHGKLASAASLS